MTSVDETVAVRTRRDLLDILPLHLADLVDEELLRDAWCAAALRLLTTIQDPRWHAAVRPMHIDWDALTKLALSGGPSRSVYLRVCAAISLGSRFGPKFDLFSLCHELDQPNYLAFCDALRIAREGLES